ncbi:MAG: hypothetical protein B7Z37_18395 [Verrucomicrobia bacterium 12-59-8]|nr:MAG: hypothetical protein B7Z37_18395 [Verrucomicrobia bacterium 12-59-8]
MTEFYPIDNRRSSNLRIAITGTVVVHALLLLLLAWMFASEAAHRLWLEAHQPPKEKEKEEEVLLFPDQFLTPPPPKPKPERQVYIRTAQNESSDTAPKNPAFIADRNTLASTKKAPSPDATEPMPSMDGLKLPTRELADRDYRDGDLKDDSRPKSGPAAADAAIAAGTADDLEAQGCRAAAAAQAADGTDAEARGDKARNGDASGDAEDGQGGA